jgi:predicted O-methyltransferase YrrM
MANPDLKPTERFSERVAYYVKYRPGYPPEVIRFLTARLGLTSAAAVADLGSGTGISAKLFLENGNVVYGIEPNRGSDDVARSKRGFGRGCAGFPLV